MSAGDGMKMVISGGAMIPTWPDAERAQAELKAKV
jgi:hypothetical protein